MENRRSTAFPFLILLVAVITVVTYADRFAFKVSEEPTIVMVSGGMSNEEYANLWQFEQETDSVSIELTGDTLYVEAVQAYQERRFRAAKSRFEMLAMNYPETAEIYNYLGLIAMKNDAFLEAAERFSKSLEVDSSYLPALINAGLAFSRLENFRKADSLYQKAILAHPLAGKVRLNKGIMHCRTEEWQAAATALDTAIVLTSGRTKAKAYSYYGLALINLGDSVRANMCFEEAINLAPDYLMPRVYLGLTASGLEQRISALASVISLDPTYAPAHFFLGELYRDAGMHQEATQSIERAMQLNPRDRDISTLVGSYYIENDLTDRASAFFEEVYAADTLLPQHYFLKAKMAVRNDEPAAAVRFYETAIERSGGNYAEAYLNLGIVLKNQARINEAIEAYRKATDLRSGYEEAWYNMALAYRSIGDNDQAVACYQKAISINGRSVKAMYNLAAVFNEESKSAEARVLWEAIVRIDPDFVKAWYNLGLSLQKAGEGSKAIEVYSQMLERFPNHTKAWYNLALARKARGDNEGAVLAYEQAIQVDPSYVAAWKNLGTLNAQRGNINAAIDQFTQAIDLDSKDPELRFNLALQLEKMERSTEAIYQLSMAVRLDSAYEKAIEKWVQLAENTKRKEDVFAARLALARITAEPDSTYNLAREIHKTDRQDMAIQAYNLAINQGKDNEWVYYWKGKANQEMMRTSRATEAYQQSLTIDPTHKFSLFRLYEIYRAEGDERYLRYRDQLIQLYPEFSIEKMIQ